MATLTLIQAQLLSNKGLTTCNRKTSADNIEDSGVDVDAGFVINMGKGISAWKVEAVERPAQTIMRGEQKTI